MPLPLAPYMYQRSCDPLVSMRVRSMADSDCVPGQVQVGPPVKVQLILEHLVDSIGGCSLLRNDELGDLLLASVARGVGSDGGGCALGLDMVLVGLGGVVVKGLDEGIGVDLREEVSISADLLVKL